jgi:hypothetical protein
VAGFHNARHRTFIRNSLGIRKNGDETIARIYWKNLLLTLRGGKFFATRPTVPGLIAGTWGRFSAGFGTVAQATKPQAVVKRAYRKSTTLLYVSCKATYFPIAYPPSEDNQFVLHGKPDKVR